MRRVAVITSLLLATQWLAQAQAHDSSQAGAATGHLPMGQAWDFTLPMLDGSRFVQVSSLKGPVLVNFWGKDCGPCIAELPRLEAFAKAHPSWTVLLVATDMPASARDFVRRHGVQLPVLGPGANVGALMRSAGNRSGGLPFTVVLNQARVCEGQPGALQAHDLQRIASASTCAGAM